MPSNLGPSKAETLLPAAIDGVDGFDMNYSCFHTRSMQTMIQIRNVPVELHRRLKARAAMEGLSMSRYILRAVETALERPSRRELIEAIRSQPNLKLKPSPAEILRQERKSR